MCKFVNNTKHSRIDQCMKILIDNLNYLIPLESGWIVGCCCGHEKYPMTILFKQKYNGKVFDICSRVEIPRKRNFYKKDEEGHYFIPEIKQNIKKIKKTLKRLKVLSNDKKF